MAENLELEDESTTNPCCNEWKNRILKLQKRFERTEKARAALKEAVEIYERQFTAMEVTNLKFKKAYEAEKLQSDQERKDKEKESAARVSLENEISTLKSEILSLSQKGGSVPEHVDNELILLRGRVLDSEKEINRLREQLQKEISVAAADRMKYVEEKKRVDDAWQSSKAEKCRTDEELSNLKARLLTMETEKKQLRKDLQKERARADSEKKRADEALKTAKTDQIGAEEIKAAKKNMEMMRGTVRDPLVDDLSSQKSEDLLLQHKGHLGDQNLDVVTSLQGHVSEMGTEISRLKELLDKERRRADSEIKKAEAEKKKANKVQEMLKAEQSAADEQRRLVDVERKKAEETAHQLERLKCEANEARSKVAPDSSKFKEVNKKLEAERKKSIKEKKKAEKQQKIAELSTKNALEEKHRADRLHQQLEEYQQKYAKLKKEMEETISSRNVVEVPVYAPGKRTFPRELNAGSQGEEKVNGTNTARTVKNHGQVKQKTNQARNYADLEMEKEAEQKKAAETYKLQAMTEKSRADKLAQQLKDTKQRTINAGKDIQDLVSSRNLTDPSFVLIQKDIKAKSAEMKLLKKRLKLEKERVKHANRVAELEKNCTKAAEEELHRLKVEFAQFANRVGLCSCFPICNNGNVDSKRKFMQTEACPLHLQSGKELMEPTCGVTKFSEYFKPSLDCPAPSLPISGTCTESTSGTASKMEPLLGGSNRKNVDSSALVSSMASFSDRQLVGSQGNCGFFNTKPADRAKENSNLQLPISRLSSEANRTSYDAVVADNNVKSPLRARSKDGNTRKRKRLVNAIESIEHLYAEGKTWHAKIAKNMSALHGILGHMDKPLKEGMHSDYDQHHRKIEKHFEEVTVRTSCKSIEQKEEPRIKPVGDEDVEFIAFENNAVEATHTSNSDLDKLANDVEIFKRMFEGDYMKLLNLDSAVEEERYRAAVECPLSPTLPNIEFESNQSDDLDQSMPSEVNCSSGGLPRVGTCMIPCCSSGGRTKEASYNMSTLKTYGDPVEIFRNDEDGKRTTILVPSACISQDQDSDAVMGILDSGHKGTKSSCGNESGSAYDDSSQYFVVFPEIRDSSSLSKIFHTTRTFTSQCCEISQSDCVVKNVVSALSADEILSSKEKVCAFFSLFLMSFSGVALTNFNRVFDGNFLNNLDIFSGHMGKVMSDVETRTFFAEVCDLDELITLIQDFIIDGKVLVHTDKSSETLSLSDSNVHILLKDESISLSLHKASLHQLVLGAVLLASVCADFDRIESICEASYTISRIASSSTLTILHVFAYICGEKLLRHGDYSLIMTVINSLVIYCERENLSLGFPSCTKCPFFDGAVSMEELASLLLKSLWSYALCAQCEGCSTACCMHEFGIITYKSTTVPDGTLSKLGDVLSLLELLASKMNWGWVCDNIISQLLKLLEACVKETPLSAIFVLLGQLARLGIDANGFQDVEVENIRVKLSSFISGSTSSKIGLPVQFAAVNALLDTMPLSFQEVCNISTELQTLVSPSTPTDCIQKWFSLLSDEQKSSIRLLTSGVD
ncbi:uncharacterized protein LOC112527929 isoform X2 [Cynara cardunculus var. scolymus]|uniref:uncharacterized protein LOC112527929 isoform X2 n=1 Tax=Cynara cardunculus var. scolymus TaxID=59895 RepID=UPI000D627A28|nr:uncharacterized protein LOC112527929 isoform X2 [Cynara cardunculus var. scolymus]